MPNYIISNNQKKLNLYYLACQQRNYPYATIRKKKKYSYIEIDLIGNDFSWNLDKKQKAEIEEIIKKYILKCVDYKIKGVAYSVGTYTFCHPIPNDLAESLMQELLPVYEKGHSNKSPIIQ